MFRNLAGLLQIILTVTIATTVPALGSSQEPKHFATTYLNGLGQRLTVGYNQTEWSAPIGHLVREEAFEIAAQNNVCVSLVMTKQFKSAKRSCERALHLGTIDLQRRDANESRTDGLAILATISTNLGVVNALMGDELQAAANFNEARRMDPRQEATEHNLVTLGAQRSPVTVRAVEQTDRPTDSRLGVSGKY